MSRQPEYTRTLTDDTMFAVLQGNNQTPFPIKFGNLKAQIIDAAQKVGTVTFAAGVFSVTFTSNLSSSDYQVAWTSLPSDVNVATIVKSTGGFTGTYIGEGAGDGGFIAAVENN